MEKIAIVEVNSDLGAGTRGASLGAAAMKIAASKVKNSYFYKHDNIEIEDENRLVCEEPSTHFAKNIEGVVKIYDRMCDSISEILNGGKHFPIILGGDHSIAGGTIAGIKKAYPSKRLGVVWIDAHADLHSPYTTPSGNMHGMPLACSLNNDNQTKTINDVCGKTREFWHILKNIGGYAPKVQPEDIAYIAVRSTEDGENHLIEKHQMLNFNVTEFRQKGAQKIALEALGYLSECDLIYVSFDVDSMDPSVSLGTGTPEPDGLTVQDASTLINKLIEDPKVCCLEIAEVNPALDLNGNIMAETAFSILTQATDVVLQR